ncbi:hypothetical protein [Shewanella pealeana]|uniref:Uncharacterized protein n=1 Tax=Shewanella pealeana (strain ATCC 700345 / ANG-SQ1) TaxID=398579 RepID=A8GZT9_SHEPA|nr:hypothetical protein [Shewanella pealeana]ABV85826.1 hypothetical protein Spea_0498 [Shewanella pealeana ATCC 700345]
MAQFDKYVSIVVDPRSPESISSALAEYRQHIEKGSAFRLTMNLLLNVQFVKSGGVALTIEDAGDNRTLVEQAINACRDEQKLSYISEPVLFGAALNFPELMPAVVETVEALVAFSRSRNDSNDLWIDDCNAFGIEALYMLIESDASYSPMLARFLVPYWDTQTMTAPLCLLSNLVSKHGWSRDLIKAYVWCDGAEVRRYFFEGEDYDARQPDLLAHFESHPDDYSYFKSELLARLQTSPILVFADESNSLTQMLFEYYGTMGAWPVGCERWDLQEQVESSQEEWQDRVKQQLICGAKVEDEIIALAAILTETHNESDFFALAEAQLNGLDNVYQAWMEPAEVEAEQESEEESDVESEPEVEPRHWDEKAGRSFFSCLNPRLELLTQNRLERLSDELGYRDGQEIVEALPYMPVHLGGSAYLAQRLLQQPSFAERDAIEQWLEQHLSKLLTDFVLKYCDVAEADTEALRQWLTYVEKPGVEVEVTQQSDAKMIELVRAGMAKDGGKSGPDISAKQAAYWTLFSYDGGQRYMLTSLLLQSASKLNQSAETNQFEPSSQIVQLAKRHWQLWLSIAPQRVINRIVKFKADYPLYAAINDQDAETALFDLLQQHGVSDATLEAFTLMTDQQVADYRPADSRFARRYADKVAQYAALDSADTSMIGRQQLKQFETLLRELEYCREDQVLEFFQHLKAVNPSIALPIMPMFEVALLNTLKEDFEDDTAQAVHDKLMAYLASGEGLEALSPQALKLAKLQGWNPYPMYRGKLGPADFIWLLPNEMAERLALFLAQLGKRGLHWLGRSSVENAYVASQIQSGDIAMAERWSHPEVGNERHRDSDIGDALDVAKQSWALNWLDRAGVPASSLVYFAVHEGYEQQAFVCRLAAENRLPDMQDWLTSNERVQLLEMLQGEESLSEACTQSFLQDCSSAVKQLAGKLFGNRA